VIATSIPDEREWIQWRGRTARQDRPGQLYVVLDSQAAPLNDPKHKKLHDQLKVGREKHEKRGSVTAAMTEDAKIEALLEIADDGIGDRLKAFEREQGIGEKLNELTEKYYRAHPRAFTDAWPDEKYADDTVLRDVLSRYVDSSVQEIRDVAAQRLKIELDS